MARSFVMTTTWTRSPWPACSAAPANWPPHWPAPAPERAAGTPRDYGGVMRGVPWWGVISAIAAPVVLIGGAMSGMMVAANPEHAGGFGSVPHFVFASIGFAGLTLWPAAAAKRGPAVPWGLRPSPAAAAVAVQFALLAWFGAELILGTHQVGLAERAVGVIQAGWPLAVVLSCYLTLRAPAPSQITEPA